MGELYEQSTDLLQFHTPLLNIDVLGGIKLEGLDRMRVTLKVSLPESSKPPVRHNLDLYNDTQLEKFIRKIAERLEVGTSLVGACLAELTEALEQYRLEKLEQQEDKPQTVQLTKAEQEEAETFLKEANLLQRTNELIGQSGIIGEESNRLIMLLIYTTRKREKPLHIVSLGSSGSGKTHLQEKVGALIPEEDRIEITALSENAFYYFGQRELQHKLILIEDLDGLAGGGSAGGGGFYPLRELQSKKKISKRVPIKNTKGETRTIHLTVEGPVSVSGCTTKEQIYEDNANRSFLIYLDESHEQDQRIMDYQRAWSAGKVNTDNEEQAADLLRNCQRILKPIKVVNPFAQQLRIPREVFKPRRTNDHYLQFIEAVTFYHQYQRNQQVNEETGEIYIETTIEDIQEANQLLKQILLRKSDELTGACRNHFEKLKLYLIGEAHPSTTLRTSFTNKKIAQLFRIPITTVKRYHLDLVQCGYLKTKKEKATKAYSYEVVSYEEYKALQQRIETVLDQSLEVLRSGQQPSSPNQPTTTSGPKKKRKVKELAAMAQKPTKGISGAKEL